MFCFLFFFLFKTLSITFMFCLDDHLLFVLGNSRKQQQQKKWSSCLIGCRIKWNNKNAALNRTIAFKNRCISSNSRILRMNLFFFSFLFFVLLIFMFLDFESKSWARRMLYFQEAILYKLVIYILIAKFWNLSVCVCVCVCVCV